eukprot:6208770-Pleurochrysis_carterae.AAC.2
MRSRVAASDDPRNGCLPWRGSLLRCGRAAAAAGGGGGTVIAPFERMAGTCSKSFARTETHALTGSRIRAS